MHFIDVKDVDFYQIFIVKKQENEIMNKEFRFRTKDEIIKDLATIKVDIISAITGSILIERRGVDYNEWNW